METKAKVRKKGILVTWYYSLSYWTFIFLKWTWLQNMSNIFCIQMLLSIFLKTEEYLLFTYRKVICVKIELPPTRCQMLSATKYIKYSLNSIGYHWYTSKSRSPRLFPKLTELHLPLNNPTFMLSIHQGLQWINITCFFFFKPSPSFGYRTKSGY